MTDFKQIEALVFPRAGGEPSRDINFDVSDDRIFISINDGYDSGQDSLSLTEALALRDWLDRCLPKRTTAPQE